MNHEIITQQVWQVWSITHLAN